MAIKISSINIRRFYREEELAFANKIREVQTRIEDSKTLEKLQQLKDENILYSDDVSVLTLDELQDYFLSESFNNKDIKFRDSKKVQLIKNFIKKNEKLINNSEIDEFSRNSEELKEYRKNIKDCSETLKSLLKNNKAVRKLEYIYDSDLVALSQSALTNALLIEDNKESNKIVIVTSDQEYMMRDLINDGFIYKDKKYELYSASAGQLRK